MGITFMMQILMTMVLTGFGGGDLLDFMTTDSYWHTKHVTVTVDQLKEDARAGAEVADITPLIKDLSSKEFKVRDAARKKIEAMGPGVLPQLEAPAKSEDDEVAETAIAIQKKLTGRAREREVRRLMGIRTLGERKEAGALPVLEEALKSKDVFVAEYAARAIAMIQGKPVPAREVRKIDRDVWLIPGETAVVGQILPGGKGEPFTIDSMLENMLQSVPVPEGAPKPNKDELIDRNYTSMLEMIERVGNLRIDGATVGVSKDAGDRDDKGEKGWAVFTIRGTFDKQALIEAVKSIGGGVKVTVEDGVDVVDLMGSGKVAVPSNELAIFVVGPAETELPVKTVLASLKSGKGALQDSPLAPRIKTLQAGAGPAWALITPNKSMQKEIPWFAGFATVTLTTKANEKEKTIDFVATGEGADAEKVKESATQLETDIKKASAEIHKMADAMPMFKTMAAIIDSFKVESKDTKATFTGTIPTDLSKLIGGAMGGMGF